MERWAAMKIVKLVLAMLLLATIGANPAWARGHGHGHVHFGVGVVIGPYWGPWFYPPPPYYYYPPLVIERSPPPVYVEQPAPYTPPPTDWYYCPEAKMYYPYVKTCPHGWQRVAPQPSAP
jgi:hypothetical protein